jgi:hypothetical protein
MVWAAPAARAGVEVSEEEEEEEVGWGGGVEERAGDRDEASVCDGRDRFEPNGFTWKSEFAPDLESEEGGEEGNPLAERAMGGTDRKRSHRFVVQILI